MQNLSQNRRMCQLCNRTVDRASEIDFSNGLRPSEPTFGVTHLDDNSIYSTQNWNSATTTTIIVVKFSCSSTDNTTQK